MKLHKDIREFIALCLSQRVEFLLVGGYALAFHGAPRFTEDVIGKTELIRNKQATGRPQDFADLARLTQSSRLT